MTSKYAEAIEAQARPESGDKEDVDYVDGIDVEGSSSDDYQDEDEQMKKTGILSKSSRGENLESARVKFPCV